MKRKNKVMLALALGAVALVIASGAVRCSLATPEPSEESTLEQGRVESSGEAAHEEPSAASFEEAGAQGGFADLKNTTWVSEDGKSALSIIEGAFIESGEAGQSILYYSVESEQTQNDGITATLAVSDSMTGDEELTVAVFQTSSEGERTLTCDKLSCAYVLEEVQATAITVTEADERLYSTFGKSEDDFANALLEYARAKAPSATCATWSKEVWIDFGQTSYLTNFTLDDAASSIVTVQMDASGKLGAL